MNNMENIRYIHGIEFKKVANLDKINYESVLQLYNINRSTKFIFNYDLTDSEVEFSLTNFADTFKQKFNEIANFLVHDADQVLKNIQLISDKELIDLTKIERYEDIYLFLTYTNVTLYKNYSEMNILCEWDYSKKTKIIFKNDDFEVYRDDKKIDINNNSLTQFEYLTNQ